MCVKHAMIARDLSIDDVEFTPAGSGNIQFRGGFR